MSGRSGGAAARSGDWVNLVVAGPVNSEVLSQLPSFGVLVVLPPR